MTRNIDEHIIMSCIQGYATQEELAILNEWIAESEDNARHYFEMEDTHRQLLASVVPAGKVEAALRDIMESEKGEVSDGEGVATVVSVQQKSFRSIRTLLKYAAVLVLGIVLGGALIYKIGVNGGEPREVYVAKATGGTQQMTLADGTRVWLREGATLRYPDSFNEEQRRVSLDGEAYFEVEKDAEHPFIVEGNTVDVKVLGTKFNFQTISGKHNDEVALVEGSVDVSNRETKESVLLSPGQKATLEGGHLVVSHANTILAAVWHDDLIPFDNANIREIGDALAEIYNVKVSYADGVNLKKTYSGVIRRKDDVSSVMRLLQNTIPVNFRLHNGQLTIMP